MELQTYQKVLVLHDNPMEWATSLTLGEERIIIYPKEKSDLSIDEAREIISESYIASKDTKNLVIATQKFGIEAQNALLKLIEEPPLNVRIIVVAPAKSSLLTTIRSRLPLINLKTKPTRPSSLTLDLHNIKLSDVYQFIKSCENISKNDAKERLHQLCYTIMQDFPHSQHWGYLIERAWKLIELNAKSSIVFTHLLLHYALTRKSS